MLWMTTNRYWTLTADELPNWPNNHTFIKNEGKVPNPLTGQALTRTIYVSLDPYQWSYVRDRSAARGLPFHARTVAQVIESRIDGLAPGDFVFNTNGWAEYGLMGEGIWRPDYMVPRKLEPAVGRISHSIGVLGMLGLTAYAGMNLMAAPKLGETVVVSAASGGVGQIAGQLAKLQGARVIGIAGRVEKCKFVREGLGMDDCVSHLSPSFAADLAAACPSGIDVCFENVGGKVFEAVIPLLNNKSRMVICGAISTYGDPDGGAGRRARMMAEAEPILKSRDVNVQNLHARNYAQSHTEEMLAYLGPLVKSQALIYHEDIEEGFDALPSAFLKMLSGGNLGKTIVRIGNDPTL